MIPINGFITRQYPGVRYNPEELKRFDYYLKKSQSSDFTFGHLTKKDGVISIAKRGKDNFWFLGKLLAVHDSLN